MDWTIKPVGNRNQLHEYMKYQISWGILEFFDARDWCWSQWGSGIESMHWINYYEYTGKKMPWAWDCMKYRGSAVDSGTLYLSTDLQLEEFKSKWPIAA